MIGVFGGTYFGEYAVEVATATSGSADCVGPAARCSAHGFALSAPTREAPEQEWVAGTAWPVIRARVALAAIPPRPWPVIVARSRLEPITGTAWPPIVHRHRDRR